jgi:hypothetical protein
MRTLIIYVLQNFVKVMKDGRITWKVFVYRMINTYSILFHNLNFGGLVKSEEILNS